MADVQIPRAIDIREKIAHLKAELKTLRKLLRIAEQAEAAVPFKDSESPVFCDMKTPEGIGKASKD